MRNRLTYHPRWAIRRTTQATVLVSGALLFVVLAGCGQAHSEQRRELQGEPIATVDGEPIYSEDFREGYIDYLLKTGLQDTPSYRRQFLESQIAARMIVQDAVNSGITEEVRYREAVDRIEKKLLVDVYTRKAIFDTIRVDEDEMKDMFVRARTTLTARHLYARTKEQADRLYERLQNGEPFEDLARDVFADSALAYSGGYIGEFTLDDMDLNFEEAAFGMEVGEVSAPVKTAQGYSIIKLEGRFVKPLITEYEYAEKRDRMEHFVLYRKKVAARKAHVAEAVHALAPVYNEPVLDRLFAHVEGRPSFESGEGPTDWRDEELVSFELGGHRLEWTVRDFVEAAGDTRAEQRERVQTREHLVEFVNGLIVREDIARRAVERGYHRLPAFEVEKEKAVEGWIWSQSTAEIMERVVIPEDTLKAYYDAYRDEFAGQPRVRVGEILVETKERAEDVLAALGEHSFEELAQEYSLRPGADRAGGDLGYLNPEQLGVMAGRVMEAREGDVLGPIEVQGHYVILKVGDRRPAERQSFEEARPEIEKRLYFKKSRAHLKERIDSMRSVRPVTIDDALLMGLPLKASTDASARPIIPDS